MSVSGASTAGVRPRRPDGGCDPGEPCVAILTPGQQARFTFTLDAAKRLALDSFSTNTNLTWSLVGPRGVVISGRNLAYSDAGQIGGTSPVMDLVAGDYTLTVDASGDITGPFAFRLVDLSGGTTIGYDTPWRQVEAMLIAAAGRTPGILTTPSPRVFQTALSDYYPEYCLVAQALPAGAYPRAEVVSRLHANIQDVFNEHGVQIMSPHYMSDPTNDKIVPREKWYTPPAREPEA